MKGLLTVNHFLLWFGFMEEPSELVDYIDIWIFLFMFNLDWDRLIGKGERVMGPTDLMPVEKEAKGICL